MPKKDKAKNDGNCSTASDGVAEETTLEGLQKRVRELRKCKKRKPEEIIDVVQLCDALLIKDVLCDLIKEKPEVMKKVSTFLEGEVPKQRSNIRAGSLSALDTPPTSPAQRMRNFRAMSVATPTSPSSSPASTMRRNSKKKPKHIQLHDFVPTDWKPREICDVCSREMKGRFFKKQGVSCTNCDFKCHHKCMIRARVCTAKSAFSPKKSPATGSS